MKNRIIFGLIAFALLLVVVMSHSAIIMVSIGVIIAMAIWEIWLIVGRKNLWEFMAFSLIIAAGFSCLALIRMGGFGEYTIWFPFVGAFITDTFAYIFGMWLGQKNGHKLAPKISPKKSWEGSIGGVIGTTAFMAGWGMVLKMMSPITISIAGMAVLGFASSIVAQFGDLAASWVKRKYGVKDFGNCIPGHGGIMDRCDSLLFVAPFVYLFIKCAWNI